MSLAQIISDDMTVEQMRTLAGKKRSKGAKVKEECMHGVFLALAARGEKGVEALPLAAQKKLGASPVAQRELERVRQAASGGCDSWMELKQVLQRFPPSILLQILNEEMTATQMKTMAGKGRCERATVKAELTYAVLLALAERGSKAMRDLPATALARIEAAPVALEWVKMMERADPAVLSKLGTWAAFRELLCTPHGSAGDGEEDSENDTEEEEEHGAGAEAAEAAARVAELEAKLAEAKAELLQSTGTKASRTKPSAAAAAQAKKKLDFQESSTVKASSSAKGAVAKRGAAVPAPTPLWLSLMEVALTFLLPFALILAVISSGKMPGKPGDDIRLHKLAL